MPLLAQFGTSSNGLVPDDGEVCLRAEVVGDCYRGVEVEDHVPVTAWNEHRLTGVLDHLNLKAKQRLISHFERSQMSKKKNTYGLVLLRPVRSLGLGIDEIEPGDGLVRLLVVVLRGDLDELLGRVRREETPPFVTGDEGVPGGCAYRNKT